MSTRVQNCATCGHYKKGCWLNPTASPTPTPNPDPTSPPTPPPPTPAPRYVCWATYSIDKKTGKRRDCSELIEDDCEDHIGHDNIGCRYELESKLCVSAKHYKTTDEYDKTWDDKDTWASENGIFDCTKCKYDGEGRDI